MNIEPEKMIISHAGSNNPDTASFSFILRNKEQEGINTSIDKLKLSFWLDKDLKNPAETKTEIHFSSYNADSGAGFGTIKALSNSVLGVYFVTLLIDNEDGFKNCGIPPAILKIIREDDQIDPDNCEIYISNPIYILNPIRKVTND